MGDPLDDAAALARDVAGALAANSRVRVHYGVMLLAEQQIGITVLPVVGL